MSAVTCMQDGLKGAWVCAAAALATVTEATEAAATVDATEAAEAMDRCGAKSAVADSGDASVSDRVSVSGVAGAALSAIGIAIGMGCWSLTATGARLALMSWVAVCIRGMWPKAGWNWTSDSLRLRVCMERLPGALGVCH